MLGRLLIAALVMLFLAGAVSAVWNFCDWPPPRLILKYGFPPTGGPTGRTMTIEGVEFVELKPGYFRMGSHFLCERGDLLGRVCAVLRLPWGKQPKHDSNECPPHWVEIARAFWIARTEVTNKQYERFDPGHERDWPGDDDPVSSVSWDGGLLYCAWLSRSSGRSVDLPNEEEWEFACRAGTASDYSFGDDPAGLEEHGWFEENLGLFHDRRPAATRLPNTWGLFDLHGGVNEWCRTAGSSGSRAKPVGQTWGSWDVYGCEEEGLRICRGGCWASSAAGCRSACRSWENGDLRAPSVGLRVAVR